jgi:uncharacterized membrane protein YeaQ/YmgE (transglycosylase-associated protein family)
LANTSRDDGFEFLAARELDGRDSEQVFLSFLRRTTMTVVGIITALIVGLIVGALGRLVVPGRQNMPIWLHMLIGVGAALLGTVLARAVGIATETAGIDWAELLVQVVVAAIAVAIVAGVGGRRSVTHR